MKSDGVVERQPTLRLIAFLLESQRRDGSFWCRRLADGRPDAHRSLYYEGEAAYSLGIIYELTKDEALLRPFRSAVAQLTSRSLTGTELLAQHWTVKALRIAARCEVWESRWFADKLAMALFDLCDRLHKQHNTASTATLATKAESFWALGDIFSMSRRLRLADDCFLKARWINELLLRRQYKTGPARGGFCRSLTEPVVRIDVVQHVLTSLNEQLTHSG